MTENHKQPVYFCDFRTPDGSTIVAAQPVRFIGEPSYFVVVDGMGFRKAWESGNQVVYVRVSTFDATSQVRLYG